MIRIVAVLEAATVTGPAKNLLSFAERARDDAEVTIATFRRGATPDNDPLLAAASAARVPVEVIEERARFERGQLASLRRIAAERHANVVQTHSVKSHFLVRLSGIWKKTPWAAFHHGYTATDFKMHAYNQFDRWSLRAARRIVTVSRAFAQELAAAGIEQRRITVIHNAADACLAARVASVDRAAVRARLRIEDGAPVVLAVGRFSREKGFGDLVEAAADVGLCVRLLFVGDGPDRLRIEQQAAARGVKVTFAGQVTDLAPYYAVATVLAMPSLSEGSPNVLLEAMSAGVPVVATAVGGVPEIVEDKREALLVPAKDPAQMAAGIRRLLDDPALADRIAAAARATAADRFSPEARTERLLALYRELA